jgi:hypothetical protein
MIDNVRQWLETQGFPLEMKTAAAFRHVGFDVRQSSHYVDSETGAAREIDVLATDPDFIGVVEIHFAIECKSSKKPWVLLASEHTLSNYNRLFALGVLTEQAIAAFGRHLRDVSDLDALPWLRKGGVTGYSFRQAFADRCDAAYSAAVSAAKACEYLVRPAERHYVAPFILAFPVIVIDAPLIQSSLQPDGQLRLQELDQGEFLFFARIPRYFGSCIRVVTSKHLAEFAGEAKKAAEHFRNALKPEEQKITESWGKKGGPGQPA